MDRMLPASNEPLRLAPVLDVEFPPADLTIFANDEEAHAAFLEVLNDVCTELREAGVSLPAVKSFVRDTTRLWLFWQKHYVAKQAA